MRDEFAYNFISSENFIETPVDDDDLYLRYGDFVQIVYQFSSEFNVVDQVQFLFGTDRQGFGSSVDSLFFQTVPPPSPPPPSPPPLPPPPSPSPPPVEILKWLREEGCPWDEFSVSHAAGQGQFETVRWLVENGCPWTQFAIQRAQTKEIGDYLNRAAQRLTPSSWIVFVDAQKVDVPTEFNQAVAPLVQCWKEAIPGMHLFPTSARWFKPETNLEKISDETGVPLVALKDFRKDKACFGMSSFFTEVYRDPEYHVIEGLAIDLSFGLALEHACLCKVRDGKVVFTFDLVRRNPLFVYGIVVRMAEMSVGGWWFLPGIIVSRRKVTFS